MLATITLLPGGIANARETLPDTLVLDLQKAVEIALSENPVIKIAEREIARVDYSRRLAFSSLLPSVTAEGSYSRNFAKPVMFLPDGIFGPGTGGPMELGHDNSITGTLMASVPLFSYSILQNIKITEHDMLLALESARASRINMITEVSRAYYALLLANDGYKVMRQSIDNARANLENVNSLFSQGLVSEFDVIRSEVQVRNLTPSLIEAQNGVSFAQMLLRVLLGLDEAIAIKVADDLESIAGNVTGAETINSLDITSNSDLRQMELQIGQMQDRFKLVRSQRFPTISAFAQYQFQAQENHFRFSEFRWAEPFIGGLSLQIPLFRGFSANYQERQLRISMEQMTLQQENLVRNLSLQAREVLLNMERALEQIESNRLTVNQAQRGFSIAQTRYTSGAGTLLELNDAEIALTQARLNLNQAMFDFLNARAGLYRLTGQAETGGN